MHAMASSVACHACAHQGQCSNIANHRSLCASSVSELEKFTICDRSSVPKMLPLSAKSGSEGFFYRGWS